MHGIRDVACHVCVVNVQGCAATRAGQRRSIDEALVDAVRIARERNCAVPVIVARPLVIELLHDREGVLDAPLATQRLQGALPRRMKSLRCFVPAGGSRVDAGDACPEADGSRITSNVRHVPLVRPQPVNDYWFAFREKICEEGVPDSVEERRRWDRPEHVEGFLDEVAVQLDKHCPAVLHLRALGLQRLLLLPEMEVVVAWTALREDVAARSLDLGSKVFVDLPHEIRNRHGVHDGLQDRQRASGEGSALDAVRALCLQCGVAQAVLHQDRDGRHAHAPL
eukprot:8516146-Heterocapsa_arctica.AAC.1